MNDVAGQEEVKSLFSGSFYSKVLNAVAMTRDNLVKDSILMWKKSPCATVSPKVTNVWKESSGFRKGLFIYLPLKYFCFVTSKTSTAFSHDTIFERNILKDISCQVIKGVTQHYPPFSYITKEEGSRCV